MEVNMNNLIVEEEVKIENLIYQYSPKMQVLNI